MKKSQRLGAAIALAAAASLTLASCGFGGGGSGGESEGGTTLDLLVPSYSDATQGLWEDVIDGFEKTSRAPWFVWWTPTAPHHGLPRESDDPAPTRRRDGQFSEWDTPGRPNWVKGKFDSQITHGAGVPTSGSAEEDTSDKPYYLRKQPELTQAEKDAETNVTRQRGESLFALDVQIRQTFRHLRTLHQLRNTVIVFTSDNGYYLGEHLRRTGKVNLHEPSLRVPLLVVGPGVPHGRRYDPVTTVDLAPTFAAYAGTVMPGADGSSMLPTISGDQGWDRAVVTEGMMGFGRYGEKFALGRSPLDTRGLRSLGGFSYSLYLTHAPIVIAVAYGLVLGRVPPGAPTFLVLAAVVVPLTVGFARGFAAVFELPFQRHRGWAPLLRAVRNRLG